MNDDKSASKLIEQGVGLIAQGMFRTASKDGENDPKEAYERGMVAVSIIRDSAFDFLKQANARKGL